MDGAVFNTGIVFFSSTLPAIRFCELWANTTLALPSERWWSDDQGEFNRLLTGRGAPSCTKGMRARV